MRCHPMRSSCGLKLPLWRTRRPRLASRADPESGPRLVLSWWLMVGFKLVVLSWWLMVGFANPFFLERKRNCGSYFVRSGCCCRRRRRRRRCLLLRRLLLRSLLLHCLLFYCLLLRCASRLSSCGLHHSCLEHPCLSAMCAGEGRARGGTPLCLHAKH